jgi:hypothetical protein
MSRSTLRRRRGGLLLAVFVDVWRDAWQNRGWAVLAVTLLTVVAVAIGTAGQAAVPFLVYGGL